MKETKEGKRKKNHITHEDTDMDTEDIDKDAEKRNNKK